MVEQKGSKVSPVDSDYLGSTTNIDSDHENIRHDYIKVMGGSKEPIEVAVGSDRLCVGTNLREEPSEEMDKKDRRTSQSQPL
jgi:hypothetical protein